ncbi:unnamed protein product [Hymenolepis diminuta]|uniref:Transmembrane protein 256 homolog n=1 Tax=Hymenolepis diminuta TaxID=6216 RepID=A0A564Z699_HYMDI|nr:unnamed protein product [Hymenolepis diminuta]
MDSIKWICSYLTWPLTQMTEKAPGIPIRISSGANAKLAGILGATAVAALAYSAHGFQDSERSGDRFKTFKNGADINILHSLALLGVQSSRFPKLTTALFLVGTVLFSGTCYYTALTNDRRLVRIAPIGGTTLIIAWLTFVL